MLAISLGASLATTAVVEKDDWRSLVAHIRGALPAGEAVVLDQPWDDLPFNHYRPDRPPVTSQDTSELESLLSARGHLWLVAHRRLGQPVPASAVESWLDGHAHLSDVHRFARLELRRYDHRRDGQ